MSQIVADLLNTSFDGAVSSVLIGLHWTAVVAETAGGRRCGLASTLHAARQHHWEADIPQAGQLADMSASALAGLISLPSPLLAGIGAATINAFLSPDPHFLVDLNAEEVIGTHGAGKKVALIGHFPFVPRLRNRVGELHVLEQNPRAGDLPADDAADILPGADVVAITGTTLINHTLDELLGYCAPQALVILLGPSTPLNAALFDHGIDILCGSIVDAVDPVLQVVGQGGTFRQVRRAGVRTVTMTQPGYNREINSSDHPTN